MGKKTRTINLPPTAASLQEASGRGPLRAAASLLAGSLDVLHTVKICRIPSPPGERSYLDGEAEATMADGGSVWRCHKICFHLSLGADEALPVRRVGLQVKKEMRVLPSPRRET